MSIVELLLDTAREDTNLLIKNDELGDNFNIPRTVDFILTTTELEKAETARDFIDDNRYGDSSIEQIDDQYRVVTKIIMPINQNILCSVSGLIACVGKIFDLEYDGWGSEIQK
ncbi:ribonuclease E inhibitor RraB [Lentisphaera marina]|uniref:ribonuclease E inhibitor RraB n=1 Tax=Lentisphaera marina TaxID=1111041 RepID=UPI002366CE6D|nr:ribonuclease E inhibitor RraB [Lentisphaera marina]MDD7985360.1 ribonuclease E inhibitor RraB [Lentisphaera marina]